MIPYRLIVKSLTIPHVQYTLNFCFPILANNTIMRDMAHHYRIIYVYLPRAHVLGVKQLVVSLSQLLSSSSTKITRSWDLGTSVTRKHNKSVQGDKKLASGCLELSGTAYKLYKQCISVGYRSHTNRPCPLCIMHVFLLMRTCTGLVRVGKGCQQHMSKLHDINADARCARGMCSQSSSY